MRIQIIQHFTVLHLFLVHIFAIYLFLPFFSAKFKNIEETETAKRKLIDDRMKMWDDECYTVFLIIIILVGKKRKIQWFQRISHQILPSTA